MPSPIVLTSYTQVASSGGFQANMCNTWYMVASNDGSSWVQLDSKSGYTWTASQSRTFTISNTTACSYYRIVITLVNGNELTFFGIFYNGYQQITNSVAVQGALGIGTTNPTNGEYLSVSGNSYFNGNVGIGSTSPNTNFDVNGKILINNGSAGPPVTAQFGGVGDRIILFGGSSSAYPYSFGINSSTLWYSTPVYHTFYCNGTNTLLLNASSNMSSCPVGINTSALTNNTNCWLDVGGASTNIYYSYLNGLRISRQDPNTLWNQNGSITITANPSTNYVNISVGNGNTVVKVANTGTTLNGSTTINYLGIGTAADGTAGDLTVNNNCTVNNNLTVNNGFYATYNATINNPQITGTMGIGGGTPAVSTSYTAATGALTGNNVTTWPVGALFWGGGDGSGVVAENLGSGLSMSLKATNLILAQGFIATSDRRILNQLMKH